MPKWLHLQGQTVQIIHKYVLKSDRNVYAFVMFIRALQFIRR